MKLATALAERSDIQNRINTISVRLDNNAKAVSYTHLTLPTNSLV